jgi:hypothetical protein
VAVVFVAYRVIGLAMPAPPLHVHQYFDRGTFVVGVVGTRVTSVTNNPRAGPGEERRTADGTAKSWQRNMRNSPHLRKMAMPPHWQSRS